LIIVFVLFSWGEIRHLQAFQLGVELLAALFECAVLYVEFHVAHEVLNLALENLHLVHELVEFSLVLHYQLLLHVHV